MTDPSSPSAAALVAAAVGTGVLVGCTSGTTPQPPPPSGSGSPSAAPADPRQAAIAAARDREVALLAAYDDPHTASPGLVGIADDARLHHLLHLRALDALAGSPPAQTPTAPPATPQTDAVAGARALLAAERAAADAAIVALGDVDDAAVRRLLAEIAASEAEHATAIYVGLREGLIRRRSPAATAPGPVRS